MTETIQQPATTVDGFPVDASVKYKVDAGQCESCGHYKTWGFKVANKKSGKMMPGHVTGDGFKIGEGECPKWARIAGMNAKRAERKATGAPAVPPAPGAWIKEITGEAAGVSATVAASVANSPGVGLGQAPLASGTPAGQPQAAQPAEPGVVIAFTVNGFTVTTSVTQALGVVEQIAAGLRKAAWRPC